MTIDDDIPVATIAEIDAAPGVEIEAGEYAAVEITAARDRSPRTVLLSTSLAVFAVFLDTTIGFITFPAISATFRAAGPSTVSWVLNAYTLVFAALLIPSGRLADRIGRRKMFLAGVVVFTVGSMACGLAPNVGLLIAAEMLEAIGAAILVPASLALVLQSFPFERQPFAVAIWGAIGAVAGAAGPVLGAVIVSDLSWRWAFFLNLPVGIVSLILGTLVLPEGREANPGRLPDPIGVVALTAGVGLITYGLVETNSWGWTSGRFFGVVAGGIALVGAFALRCARVPNPIVRLHLFRVRNFRWGGLSTLIFSVGFSAMFLSNVLFLTGLWHYSILRAGLAMSLGPLIVAFTAPWFGKLAGRIGQRRLLVPGGLVWAASGVWLLARVTPTPNYVGAVLPASVLSALGVALCLPQLSSASVQGLPIDQLGTGSAVVSALRYLGSTLGVALVIAFTTAAAGPLRVVNLQHVWWMLVTCAVCVSLTSSRLRHAVR